jgi:hypothetical protein
MERGQYQKFGRDRHFALRNLFRSSSGSTFERKSQNFIDFWRVTGEAWMRDPNTVAAIVSALRQVHGDDIARVMLNDGLSLAALIDALSRSPLKNRDAVKLITRALSSGDFIVTPDFGSPSHLKYFYDRPKSLHVVDIGVMTLDHGTIASKDIPLRLMPSDN